jgi:hypothetical protein
MSLNFGRFLVEFRRKLEKSSFKLQILAVQRYWAEVHCSLAQLMRVTHNHDTRYIISMKSILSRFGDKLGMVGTAGCVDAAASI